MITPAQQASANAGSAQQAAVNNANANNAPGVASGNTAATSQAKANAGVPTGTSGGNAGFAPAPTLSANTSTPAATTVPPPVVVGSQSAISNLSHIGTQIGNINGSANNAPVAPPSTTPQTNSTAPVTSTPANTTTTAPPVSGTTTLDQQIQALLAGENTDIQSVGSQDHGTVIQNYTADEVNAIWGSTSAPGLTQNPDGTYTADNTALASAGIVDANGNPTGANPGGVTTTQSIPSQLNNTTAQSAATYAKMTSDLAAIQNGTYPLTPSEQALVSSSQQQASLAMQQQLIANQSLVGQTQESLASTGGMMGAMQMSAIANAISVGNNRISSLNARLSQTMATLTQSFMTEDYNNITKAWSLASSYFNQRTTELQKMQDSINTSQNNMIKDIQTRTQEQLTALISSQNADSTAARDANTAAYQNATITEKQYMDNATIINDKIKNQLEQEKIDQGTPATRTQQAMDAYTQAFVPGATWDGVPTIDANGYATPAAWKAAIAEAPSHGITSAKFIQSFADKIYMPDIANYGLTPEQVRSVTGVLPAVVGGQ